MSIEEGRKARRTNKTIEIDIMSALERLVIKKGFTNISMLSLVKEANIDSNLFYRRYGTIENLFEEFIKKHDFWLIGSSKISELNEVGGKIFYADLMKKLLYKLLKDPLMQKVLLWELSDNNPTTTRTSFMREKLNMSIITFYEDFFKSSDIDINCLSVILIGGIYYSILHRERSLFCSVDLNTPEGINRLYNAIDMIVEMVFNKLIEEQKMKDTIQRMQDDGVTQNKICKYLGISLAQFEKAVKSRLFS